MNINMRVNRYSNRRRNTVPPVLAVIMPLMFVIAGILILFSSISQKTQNDEFMKTAVPVQATCTDVWYTRSGSSKHRTTHYYASAYYEYEGITYHIDKISVNSSTHVGSKMTLYIQPNNPGNPQKEYTTGKFVVNIVVSVFCMILGFSVSAFMLVTRRRMLQGANTILGNTSSNNYIPPNNNYNNYNGYQNNNGYNDYNSYNQNNNTYNNYNDYSSYNQNSNNYNDYNSYNQNSNTYNDYNSYNQNDSTYNGYSSGYTDGSRENNEFYSGNIFNDDWNRH